MVNERRPPSSDASSSGRGEARTATRRRLLTALGAACVPAVAGCSSAPAGEEATDTTTATTETTTQTTQTSEESIDARFGYTGTGDDAPPVEADHTVNLIIGPREEVGVPEFYFEPARLFVEPGDTVRFNLATPHHNVNAYHPGFGYTRRVPEGTPAFSSPVLTGGDYWLYTFENEGVHDVTCAPHEVYGMAGRIVVGSASGPGANPVGEAPGGESARPPEFTAALVLSDPALDPGTIVEEGSVSWDDVAEESKRPLLAPVEDAQEE